MSWIKFVLMVVLFWVGPLVAEPGEHNVIECMILDAKGTVIRKYPGSQCLFFANGELASASVKNLTYYDGKMKSLWSRPLFTNHQLNLSRDGRALLVMHSEFIRLKNRRVRFDVLSVVARNGKVLKSFRFWAHWSELLKRRGLKSALAPNPLNRDLREGLPPDVKVEATHANSFYEIPENDLAKTQPAFTPGHYLVHDSGLVLVLDSDLKKIVWSAHWPEACMHDVQMQSSGRLLAYVNFHRSEKLRHSSIEEVDPNTGERQILFQGRPPESFYSEYCGGVQRLPNGNLLVSDYSQGGWAREFDPRGQAVWKAPYPVINVANGLPDLFLQVKRFDLSDFLNHNSGL